ncbi:hypothetical protein H4582DRAFT_1952655, partial [Lactarius indigo]
MISAFATRGDIIVADRGTNFAFYFHGSLVRSQRPEKPGRRALGVEKERRKRRGPLTRRFIVTEGIFEKDDAMA